MKRALIGAALLLLLAACHRGETVDAPDADADLRAKTAAKTVADLAAADAAARRPLPRVAAPVLLPERPVSAEQADEQETELPDNGAD